MTSALSRPFDRFMVGMFFDMFHALFQPLLWQLACASLSSSEQEDVPILNDTPNCIPCLRCVLFEFNVLHPSTSIVAVRKQEVASPHAPRGCLAPLFPPPSYPHHTLGKRLLDLAQHTAWQELQDAPVSFLRS